MPSSCLSGGRPLLEPGNLLGTTRPRQPGPSFRLPRFRSEATSGGVFDSFPSQNGQKAGTSSFFAGPAGRKSSGLLLLSEARMTQRPLMISLRNSDMVYPINSLILAFSSSREADLTTKASAAHV